MREPTCHPMITYSNQSLHQWVKLQTEISSPPHQKKIKKNLGNTEILAEIQVMWILISLKHDTMNKVHSNPSAQCPHTCESPDAHHWQQSNFFWTCLSRVIGPPRALICLLQTSQSKVRLYKVCANSVQEEKAFDWSHF